MDKPKFETNDLTSENIKKIAELFPEVMTEGKINFDMLRTILGDDVAGDEAYEFTWVGKREAVREAGKPVRKTLRPCIEESRNWDTTGNLYIEGDNLDVLKLLQESYLNRVKMIYIDPPYNTGNDFLYRDNFRVDDEEYDEQIGMFDEERNRQFSENNASNPRFHSDWCSMMYPRLVLARNLLRDDGVIFISIDDNEVAQLRKMCDEVFGASNFIAQLIWERAFSPKNDAKYVSISHDYVLIYVKSINVFNIGRLPRTEEANARYSNPDNDPRGVWSSSDISVKTYNPESDYPITLPSGRVIEPPTGRCWRLSKNAFSERLQDNRVWFGPDGNSTPRIKRFLSDLRKEGMTPTSILFHKDVGHSQEGAQELNKLLEAGVFDGPKPLRLLRRLITLANTEKDSIVLDFFAGSATTAHAVMQLNAEDEGKRKFIMVQWPEICPEGSEAAKAGFTNICEIGKERIRRAGDKIKKENPLTMADLDIGFRVLKLDDTNMEDIYYAAGDYTQEQLKLMVSNIKPDRTDQDLLYSCLLDWGLPLSLPHTHEEIEGVMVHTYNGGDLIACFAENVSETVVKEIAKRQPLRAVFRDSGFASSPAKINVEEIFKLLAPNTNVKVL